MVGLTLAQRWINVTIATLCQRWPTGQNDVGPTSELRRWRNVTTHVAAQRRVNVSLLAGFLRVLGDFKTTPFLLKIGDFGPLNA